MIHIIAIVFIAVTAWVSQQVVVQAGTVSTSFPVSATVGEGCTINVSGISFPSLAQGGVSDASGSISVTCPLSMAYNVTMNSGLNYDSASGRRRMNNGAGQLLTYNLYRNSGFSQIWGDSGFQNTIPNGTPLPGTGTGAPQTVTVFGHVHANQTVPNGTYTDDVLVTVNF